MSSIAPLVGIREVARVIGAHPNSIRRAEREHRIPPAAREPVSGIRVYSKTDIERLRRWISYRPRRKQPPAGVGS
jgi:DNA-binding transcriptional MerR regulator